MLGLTSHVRDGIYLVALILSSTGSFVIDTVHGFRSRGVGMHRALEQAVDRLLLHRITWPPAAEVPVRAARRSSRVMPAPHGAPNVRSAIVPAAPGGSERRRALLRTGHWVLAVLLAAVMVAATLTGLLIGRRVEKSDTGPREHFGVLQGALIGFMGLVLAFGLSLALGRYESRRPDTVEEANAIGTTYLRAQTLAERMRTETLDLLPRYTATSIAIAETTPGSAGEESALAHSARDQRRIWALAGEALAAAPDASAPRLYVESLNDTFDAQSTRVYALANRVPTAVLVLEVVGAATALGVLALHLATLGGGVTTSLISVLLVTLLLVVTFDLDRPARGLIRVPATPLTDVLATMSHPPAAAAPD